MTFLSRALNMTLATCSPCPWPRHSCDGPLPVSRSQSGRRAIVPLRPGVHFLVEVVCDDLALGRGFDGVGYGIAEIRQEFIVAFELLQGEGCYERCLLNEELNDLNIGPCLLDDELKRFPYLALAGSRGSSRMS